VTQIQSYYKKPIEMNFTPAPELFYQAARRHLIASQTDVGSPISVQFNSLASKIEIRSRP
jgi:hypothetical protein